MKAQIQAKTRNRGRGWAEYRRPDVKKGRPGAESGGTAGDALSFHVLNLAHPRHHDSCCLLSMDPTAVRSRHMLPGPRTT
jgi:hypothetical protein